MFIWEGLPCTDMDHFHSGGVAKKIYEETRTLSFLQPISVKTELLRMLGENFLEVGKQDVA